MIGKGNSISHTSASIAYGWNQEKDAVVILKEYLAGNTPRELTNEFQIIQDMNQKCKKNTLSFVLSPTIEDGKKLSKKDLGTVTKKFLTEMKLAERQAIAFVHRDKAHTHIHLYVNRIDFYGKAYNDGFIGKRSSRAAEKVAIQMKLKTVVQVQAKKLDTLKIIRKEIYLKHQKTVMDKKVNTLDDYIKYMSRQNIKVLPYINNSGKLQGFRFEYKGENLKASEVHRNLGGSRILKELSSNNPKLLLSQENSKVSLDGNMVGLSRNLFNGLVDETESISDTVQKPRKNGKNRRPIGTTGRGIS